MEILAKCNIREFLEPGLPSFGEVMSLCARILSTPFSQFCEQSLKCSDYSCNREKLGGINHMDFLLKYRKPKNDLYSAL
jgi:hypothetical protein